MEDDGLDKRAMDRLRAAMAEVGVALISHEAVIEIQKIARDTERQRAVAIVQEEMDAIKPTSPCRESLHWVMTRILSGSQPKNTVHKTD